MALELPNESGPSQARAPFLWLLGVVLPCVISSYSSYRIARADTEAKASAGYSTLVDSQKELQKAFEAHLKADEKATAQQAAELSVLKQMVFRLYNLGRESTMGRSRLPSQPPVAATPVRHFQDYKPPELPPTLDAAQQQVINSKK